LVRPPRIPRMEPLSLLFPRSKFCDGVKFLELHNAFPREQLQQCYLEKWPPGKGLWLIMFFRSSHARACLTCAIFADSNKIQDKTPFFYTWLRWWFYIILRKIAKCPFFLEWCNLDF
jgi:hypothetical protein